MQPPPGGPVPCCFSVGSDGLGEMLAPSKWRGVKQSKFVGKKILPSNLESVEYGRELRWTRNKQVNKLRNSKEKISVRA
jgi:hypothetical protein